MFIQAQVHVKCAYGSLKDVTVYQQIGLKPEQIFIVGRTSKKVVKEATVSQFFSIELSLLANIQIFSI